MSTIVKVKGYEYKFESGEELNNLLKIRPGDTLQTSVHFSPITISRTFTRTLQDSSNASELHFFGNPYELENKSASPKSRPTSIPITELQLELPEGRVHVTNPDAINLYTNSAAHMLTVYNNKPYYIVHRHLIWATDTNTFYWIITMQ